MPTFLVSGSYTPEGVRGVAAEGAASRQQVIAGLAQHLGGELAAAYWTAGGPDHFHVIVTAPAGSDLAALWLTVDGSGGARVNSVTELLTAAELDAARAKTPGYRAPGQ